MADAKRPCFPVFYVMQRRGLAGGKRLDQA
jgi:hypothetical protein